MASLSDELLSFIQKELQSVEHLEVLLLLRAERERGWRDTEVYDVVRSSVASVRERLQQLADAGFLAAGEGGTYRYAPNSEQSARVIDELARAYRSSRVAVIDAIYQPQTAASELAQAFRIKRKRL